MKRVVYGLILAIFLAVFLMMPAGTAMAASPSDDMRGIWLSFGDYSTLGMKDVDETTYMENVASFLDTASKYNINTVFLHVRAFDDAIWMSDTFPASSYMSSKAARNVSAADTYSYDPLADFIEVARGYDVEVHAWMNPYRINTTMFLDPGKSANMTRVKTAIKELSAYDIDGIHFDDYFYHSQGGYVKNYKSQKVYARDITPEQKRKKVNKLIKSVYKLCKKNDLVFGISPQANYANDMNSGADVQTWLTQEGYVDYLVPQIYWTDQYGAEGTTTMYSDRLNEFGGLRTNSARLYAGLALYRCGYDFTYDHGWVRSNKNMVTQIKKAKEVGWDGFVLFSASYLYNKESAKERKNLRKAL